MPILPLSSSPSYLPECLALHNEVTRLRFGAAQDLTVVERAAARIRSSRRLIYDDVCTIAAAPEFGVGMVYWQWPTKTEVESATGSSGRFASGLVPSRTRGSRGTACARRREKTATGQRA